MKKWFVIILILLFSSVVIFFKFNQMPHNISFDEIEFARLALSLENNNYSSYSSMATGHSTLYFYILLLFIKLFGITNFALRLPSAIFGVGCVLVFFFVLKQVFNKTNYYLLPFIGAFVLLTSRWFLNFARFSFEATFLLFLELISILFVLKYSKNKENLFLVLSGIFAGFSFLSYVPGRIFFLVPLIILLYKKIKIKELFLYIVPFALMAAPLIFYLITNTDARINEVSIFSQKVSTPSKVKMISENAQKTLIMFNLSGDMNGRHNYPGKPALNLLLGLMFIAGLILAARDFKDWKNKLFIVYFIVSLSPTLLTLPLDNPNMLRTFTVLPSVIYFIVY